MPQCPQGKQNARSGGFGKLQRFSYLHTKTHMVAETEPMCSYLYSVFILLSVISIRFAVEDSNGFNCGLLPRTPSGIFITCDLCNMVPL